MKKYLVIVILCVMFIGISFVYPLIPNQSFTQLAASPILDESKLTDIALAIAHNRGLVDQPTQIFSQFIRGDEWEPLLFSYIGMNTPDRTVFLYSVKGLFTASDLNRGLDAPPEVAKLITPRPDDEPDDALTIALDANTGQILAIASGFTDDPVGEISDADRAFYREARIINMATETASVVESQSTLTVSAPEATKELLPLPLIP